MKLMIFKVIPSQIIAHHSIHRCILTFCNFYLLLLFGNRWGYLSWCLDIFGIFFEIFPFSNLISLFLFLPLIKATEKIRRTTILHRDISTARILTIWCIIHIRSIILIATIVKRLLTLNLLDRKLCRVLQLITDSSCSGHLLNIKVTLFLFLLKKKLLLFKLHFL